MAEVQVAILGLGRIGASIGLALKRYSARAQSKHAFTVTGFSTRPDDAKAAQKRGAVDSIAHQPTDAARGKDIVVIALPYAEVKAAYDYFAPELRPGAVVLDFSPLKQEPIKWAEKHLKNDAHMIGMTPLFNPAVLFDPVDTADRASESLFDDGLMLITPSVTSIPEAIELATDFSGLLGSRSQFTDPAEHDVLMAATEVLPNVLGLGYYLALSRATGWGDVQRNTNPTFGAMTHVLYDTHPDDLAAILRDSGPDVVRVLDTVMATLRDLRAALAAQDHNTLEPVIASAAETYEQWYNRRYHWKFDDDKIKSPEPPGIMSALLGGWVGNKLRNRGSSQDDDRS